MKIAIAFFIVFATISQAEAGWRCNRGHGQTLYYNSSPWQHSCYSCHAKKQQAYDWRADMTRIAARKSDNEEFSKNLAVLVGVQYQPGQYAQQSYSELTQQFAGATSYGVQGYSNSPLVDLNAVIQGQRQLAQQLTAGATLSASDTADITNQAYALENDRQVKIAQLATIASIGSAPVQQPTSTIFRQLNSTTPVQAEVATADEVAGGFDNAFVTAVNANCAACHTGQGSGVVKLDITKQLNQDQLKAMADAVDTGRMPLKPDGSPGEKLPLNIRQLFNSAAWPNH